MCIPMAALLPSSGSNFAPTQAPVPASPPVIVAPVAPVADTPAPPPAPVAQPPAPPAAAPVVEEDAQGGEAARPPVGDEPPPVEEPDADAQDEAGAGQDPIVEEPVGGAPPTSGQPPTSEQPPAAGQPPGSDQPPAAEQPPTAEPPAAEQPPTAEPPAAEDEPPAGADDGTDLNGAGEGTASRIADTQSVMAGRVTTFELGDGVDAVEILQKPDIGNLTVNPDNTLALVLTGTSYDGPLGFSYRVDFADGSTQTFDKTIEVKPLVQLDGWSTGENVYMLETDATGDLVIEHGDTHRVVHVSSGEDALSRADLAAAFGRDADDLDWRWIQKTLLENAQYGASPDMALDEDLGMRLWNALAQEGPGSHWLLLERGHEYDIDRLVPAGMTGESDLQPIHIGAYGEGAPPLMTSGQKVFQGVSNNVVIEDLEFSDGLLLLDADEFILNDIVSRGTISFQSSGHSFTVRNATIHDVVKDKPQFDTWSTADKKSGLFVNKSQGLLVEGLHVDQVGWEDDFDFFGDPDFGQAPNKMSQNVYIQHGVEDVTFRDNISMRAASFGAQVRPGGFIEDNVFIDNNAGLNALGGRGVPDTDVKSGHFSFLTDNLVTSGGAKDVAVARGALTWGFDVKSLDATLLDNTVAHLADPNNPAEFAAKTGNNAALLLDDPPFYDDTMIYNWVARNLPPGRAQDRNVEHLDTDLADRTTIQNFTAELLGKPDATIDDLGEFLRTEFADGLPNTVVADDIITYFQTTFGTYEAPRTEAETLRFVPSELADGVRWDNRINWTTKDLPGSVAGDSVDLGGNWVTFATVTDTVEDLDLGSDGRLTVTSGRLNVEGETRVGADGGEIDIRQAGQIWLTDYADTEKLDIDVEGGRFANTGFFDGLLDMHVTGGQALLGVDDATMELGQDSVLEIEGSSAEVGFDGEEGGVSLLRMEAGSELRMAADENGFSRIGEFRSGAHDTDAPDVLSAFDMGEGTILIDLTALAGGAARDEVLVETDELVGMFDSVEFIGLGPDQDTTLTVDYDTDRVTIALGRAGEGSGRMKVATVGDMLNATEDAEIWNALTAGQSTYEEIDATTPDPTLEEDDEVEAV